MDDNQVRDCSVRDGPNKGDKYPVFCGQEFVGILTAKFNDAHLGRLAEFLFYPPIRNQGVHVASAYESVEIVKVRLTFGQYAARKNDDGYGGRPYESRCWSLHVKPEDRDRMSALEGAKFEWVAEAFSCFKGENYGYR